MRRNAESGQIGTYRGHSVYAIYWCADVCPDYIGRYVTFDVPPEDCYRVHGGVAQIPVPTGRYCTIKPFCVPDVTGHYR